MLTPGSLRLVVAIRNRRRLRTAACVALRRRAGARELIEDRADQSHPARKLPRRPASKPRRARFALQSGSPEPGPRHRGLAPIAVDAIADATDAAPVSVAAHLAPPPCSGALVKRSWLSPPLAPRARLFGALESFSACLTVSVSSDGRARLRHVSLLISTASLSGRRAR